MATFRVENGEGLPDANAFVSLTYFKTYQIDHGRSTSDYTDPQMQSAIIRGTQYLSESFRWKGRRRNTRWQQNFQRLAWPRYGVFDHEGAWVRDDSIPRELQWATCEASWYELENPHGLQPAYTPHDRVKMEKAGPVSVTYETSRRDPAGSRPVLLIIYDLVGEFIDPYAGNQYSGHAIRR